MTHQRESILPSLLTLLVIINFLGCTAKPNPTTHTAGIVSQKNQITGSINIDDELNRKIKSTDTLYIIVRGPNSGPPLAVKRITQPKFPLNFSIGAKDAINPSAEQKFSSAESMTITARIARSGKTMPHKGDFEGYYGKNQIKPGDSDVNIFISQERR